MARPYEYKREFHSIAELEEIEHTLARASKHPVYTDLGVDVDGANGDPGDQLSEVDDRMVIWNNREDRMAYFASQEDYEILQHRDLIDMIRDAIGRTTGDIDMGVIRDYGERIDGTLVFSNVEKAKIDVNELVGDGYVPPESDVDPHGNARARDTLGLGMRFSNSFDGTTKVSASTMGYRFICQNWLVWGEEEIGAAETKHNVELTSEWFDPLIEEVFEQRETVEALIVDGIHEEIPHDWVGAILDAVGFTQTDQKRIAKQVKRQNSRRDGHTDQWALYQAASTEIDHGTAERSSHRTYDNKQGSVQEILTGDVDDMHARGEDTPFAELLDNNATPADSPAYANEIDPDALKVA